MSVCYHSLFFLYLQLSSLCPFAVIIKEHVRSQQTFGKIICPHSPSTIIQIRSSCFLLLIKRWVEGGPAVEGGPFSRMNSRLTSSLLDWLPSQSCNSIKKCSKIKSFLLRTDNGSAEGQTETHALSTGSIDEMTVSVHQTPAFIRTKLYFHFWIGSIYWRYKIGQSCWDYCLPSGPKNPNAIAGVTQQNSSPSIRTWACIAMQSPGQNTPPW